MADTLDVLTLDEGRAALNVATADTTKDAQLATYITAVSRRLDELCGAIVVRTVTAEEYPGGDVAITLRQAPASSATATTITTLTEYAGGTGTVLTAESLTVTASDSYYFSARTGVVTRRTNWRDSRFGSQRVVVTYVAGRYADTAHVDQKFKQAAAIMLSHLWTREKGVGGSATFGPSQEDEVTAHYGLMDKQVAILLEGEFLPPVVV